MLYAASYPYFFGILLFLLAGAVPDYEPPPMSGAGFVYHFSAEDGWCNK